jgi:hypothetical protein
VHTGWPASVADRGVERLRAACAGECESDRDGVARRDIRHDDVELIEPDGIRGKACVEPGRAAQGGARRRSAIALRADHATARDGKDGVGLREAERRKDGRQQRDEARQTGAPRLCLKGLGPHASLARTDGRVV